MTAKQMQKACADVIARRMANLRASKTETFRDAASGRSETIEKGEWQGTIFEFRLYTALLAEIKAIR